MPYISTTPIADIDDEVRTMFARQQDHYGYVPGYARVFCYRPEIMQLWAQLQAGIKRRVELRRFELVTFAAANALRSSLCSLAHGKVLTQFIPAQDVQALARGETPNSVTTAELAMIGFARKVARDAATVTVNDVDDLKQHGFSDADVFDIAAIAAARAFFTKLLDAVGVDGDEPMLNIDSRFRETMMVGRPIRYVVPDKLEAVSGATV